MIFVPATPRSQLRNLFMRKIKETGFRIKVVEQSGVTLNGMLQRSDPFKERKCNNTNCLICSTGGKGSCRSTGVTYELVCQICRHKYIGVTSRSAYTRGKEKLNSERKVLFCGDMADVHAGNIAGFTMNVTGTFQNDAIMESVKINQTEEGQLINTKEEWTYFRIPRVVVTQS